MKTSSRPAPLRCLLALAAASVLGCIPLVAVAQSAGATVSGTTINGTFSAEQPVVRYGVDLSAGLRPNEVGFSCGAGSTTDLKGGPQGNSPECVFSPSVTSGHFVLTGQMPWPRSVTFTPFASFNNLNYVSGSPVTVTAPSPPTTSAAPPSSPGGTSTSPGGASPPSGATSTTNASATNSAGFDWWIVVALLAGLILGAVATFFVATFRRDAAGQPVAAAAASDGVDVVPVVGDSGSAVESGMSESDSLLGLAPPTPPLTIAATDLPPGSQWIAGDLGWLEYEMGVAWDAGDDEGYWDLQWKYADLIDRVLDAVEAEGALAPAAPIEPEAPDVVPVVGDSTPVDAAPGSSISPDGGAPASGGSTAPAGASPPSGGSPQPGAVATPTSASPQPGGGVAPGDGSPPLADGFPSSGTASPSATVDATPAVAPTIAAAVPNDTLNPVPDAGAAGLIAARDRCTEERDLVDSLRTILQELNDQIELAKAAETSGLSSGVGIDTLTEDAGHVAEQLVKAEDALARCLADDVVPVAGDSGDVENLM